MRELLLGVDIGTSACKVAVFNREGEVIASGNGGYQVYYPHPGWAEQNPDEWWSAVCSAIGDVLKKGDIKPEEIKGIGVDGQSWSAIPIDKEGNVLANTPIWMDTRAQSICDRLSRDWCSNIFQVAGNRCSHLIRQPRSCGIRKTCRKYMKRHIRSYSLMHLSYIVLPASVHRINLRGTDFTALT